MQVCDLTLNLFNSDFSFLKQKVQKADPDVTNFADHGSK
jgi:hypothetical protein